MAIFFSGKELVNIAVGIERNGAAYYDSLSKSASGPVQAMYRNLSDKEREHIRIFQGMLKSVGEYQPPESYTEEYDLYLKALIDSNIFTDDKTAQKLAQRAGSDTEAIQIAIGAEKDSILFYYEMRSLVRTADQEVVNMVIDEEKSHLKQLSDLKKKLR